MLHAECLQALPLSLAAQHRLQSKSSCLASTLSTSLQHTQEALLRVIGLGGEAKLQAWVPVKAGPSAGTLQVNSLQGCQQQLPSRPSSRPSSMLSLLGVQSHALCCRCRRVRKDRARPAPPAEATRAAAAARAGARRGEPAAAAAAGGAGEDAPQRPSEPACPGHEECVGVRLFCALCCTQDDLPAALLVWEACSS